MRRSSRAAPPIEKPPARCFLSAKTIEFHLGHVYGKLGIRSRTELARVFEAPV